MNLASFIFSGLALQIQHYADQYKAADLSKTLKELEKELGLPRIQNYDFIIVGGGTAGCILAGRLSERFNVLLLEQGGPPPPQSQQGGPEVLYKHPAISSKFTSTPQKHLGLDNNGTVVTHTGRMLGGSGSHNSNVYNRGSPRDYDNWAILTEDGSWSYENILKHFKATENFVGSLVDEGERDLFYARGGPITVNTKMPPFFHSWLSAGRELGYKGGDPNGRQRESFTALAQSNQNGERASAYTAFIKGIKNSRKSLTVLPYSQADEILIENGTAYGVRYRRHGIPQIAHATKEIIISAGSLESPLLLIRSGIGPVEVLHQAKIDLKLELDGVGKNLRDHVSIDLNFLQNSASPIPTCDMNLEANLVKFHAAVRQGTFSGYNGVQAFISSSRAIADGEKDWPDIQLTLYDSLRFRNNAKFTLLVENVRPKSIGRLVYNAAAHLEGKTDNGELGGLDFNSFNDESDMDVLLEGLRLGMRILTQTEAFKPMNLSLDLEKSPEACRELTFDSDEFWKCFASKTGRSDFHYAGTCKMGRNNDPTAVVDSKLRVRGMNKLRVVDASIMPSVTNANTNAPTIAIATKAAADIIGEHLTFAKTCESESSGEC